MLFRSGARANDGAYHVPLTADIAVVRGAYPFRVRLSWGCTVGDVPFFTTKTPRSLPFGYGLTAGLATQSLPRFTRRFTSVTHAEFALPLIHLPAGRVRARPHGSSTPPKWETLSDGLHTRPLPALHAILGIRWSHNESRPWQSHA